MNFLMTMLENCLIFLFRQHKMPQIYYCKSVVTKRLLHLENKTQQDK